MIQNPQGKPITIKEAVQELEAIRGSTVISYLAGTGAILDYEDCLTLDNNLSQLTSDGQIKLSKLDLLLHSPGGILESAYKYFRICRNYTQEFNVIVPIFAKSAATTICLGADEIVMTTVAELGPVDPIIQHPNNPNVRVPARTIREYMDFISNPPKSGISISQDLKDSLNKSLDAYLIGSYEMALKSSQEIIKAILNQNKKTGLGEEQINKVIKEFTLEHASHSYPIDREELISLGFKNIVKAEESPELLRTIKQLFGIYTTFMSQNNLVKLQGNRDLNWHKQIIRPDSINPGTTPAPIGFL